MPAVSSLFLVAALVLAVVIGPQTRPWTWGPAMLALGISVMAALPTCWRKERVSAEFGVLALATLVAGWFAWRAWTSPVAALGQADLLLLAGTVGTFISVRGIEGHARAERILIWGIALLLLANVAAVGKQWMDPAFSPVFRGRPAGFPSGFYAHYNEAANYLIASSLLVAGAALFGKQSAMERICWGLLALAGLAAVYLTRSRGGIMGAAVGSGVFALAALVIAKRRGSRWFAPALIALPLIGVVIGGFLLTGWQDSQELRKAASGVAGVLDNSSRLYFLGIALSCIALHPVAGGGSRSFSWECFQFVDGKSQGLIITHKPELVHNELVQAATDYGLIGATLLILLLGSLVVLVVVRMLFSETPRESGNTDAWRVGGLAALAGMFVQSNFSFVFHLMPGAILLGLCLGKVAGPPSTRVGKPHLIGSGILLTAAALGCLVLLLPLGWSGTRVTRLLWPSYFSKSPPASEAKIDALDAAIPLWPQPSLYLDRGLALQTAVLAGGPDSTANAERAIRDFEITEALHPPDPTPVFNRAHLLSDLEKDAEAEAAYSRAIQLQGGMEPAFRGHFSYAIHLLRKGLRQFRRDDPAPSLATLELSAREMETAVAEMHWVIEDMPAPRLSIHETLGAAREANGNYPGAMQAYDFAAKLPNGSRAHYRAGVLNEKLAAAAWSSRQPAEAMAYFIEAKKRVGQARELPQDVTASQRIEFVAYLDQSIEFLKGAKIEPALPAAIPPP